MKILELFSGTECLSNAFRARGHECFTVDWDTRFPSSLHIDIMQLTAGRILADLTCRSTSVATRHSHQARLVPLHSLLHRFGQPDIIWAGCDCTTFSVAAIGHHRRRDPATGSLAPKTEQAARADVLDEDVAENFFLKPESVISFLTRNEQGDRCLYRVSDHLPTPDEVRQWVREMEDK